MHESSSTRLDLNLCRETKEQHKKETSGLVIERESLLASIADVV